MHIAIASLAFAVALICAAIMGYAIQRGGTCTVAAIDEVLTQRSCKKLLSLVEAALWVAGGLVVAQLLQVLPPLPQGHPIGTWTIVGAALLGLGACANGACVLGAVARFGSGEWIFIATPLGFYLGCLGAAALIDIPEARPLPSAAPLLAIAPWIAALFIAFLVWRVERAWRAKLRDRYRGWRRDLAARIWSPHAATTVIGIAFVVMLLLVGGWAYTDVLSELARSGMSASLGARAVLAVALLGGAVAGGRAAGLFGNRRPTATQLLRCLCGGMLMGAGSLLLPGGNDALVLVGMPLGWPYAWLAFATLCATIASVRLAVRAFAAWRDRRAH